MPSLLTSSISMVSILRQASITFPILTALTIKGKLLLVFATQRLATYAYESSRFGTMACRQPHFLRRVGFPGHPIAFD